eukprot:1173238-Amphidinium_carterae.1
MLGGMTAGECCPSYCFFDSSRDAVVEGSKFHAAVSGGVVACSVLRPGSTVASPIHCSGNSLSCSFSPQGLLQLEFQACTMLESAIAATAPIVSSA